MNMRQRVTRREFFRRTAGVAGSALALPYIVPSAALGKAGAVAPSNRITIGFIGVGGHGIDMNLRTFLGQPDAQAVAVCDVDSNNMNKARDIVNQKYGTTHGATYKDFREVTAGDDIDAVVVSR